MVSLFKDQQEAFSVALEMKNKGVPYGVVASRLNELGFKNAAGKLWDKHTVSRMMVSNNVRRKKPRAPKSPADSVASITATDVPDRNRLKAIKAILLIEMMSLQARVAIANQLLEGVQ